MERTAKHFESIATEMKSEHFNGNDVVSLSLQTVWGDPMCNSFLELAWILRRKAEWLRKISRDRAINHYRTFFLARAADHAKITTGSWHHDDIANLLAVACVSHTNSPRSPMSSGNALKKHLLRYETARKNFIDLETLSQKDILQSGRVTRNRYSRP